MADLRYLLMDKSETRLAVLGASYFQSFLSTGIVRKSFAFLSNRRIYFKGKCLTKVNGRLLTSNEERVVDIEDITGSGFERDNPVGVLIFSIICLCIAVFSYPIVTPFIPKNYSYYSGYAHQSLSAGYYDTKANAATVICFIFIPLFIISLVYYFCKKKTIFKLEYSGGNIAFNLHFVPFNEAQEFNRTLRLAKDNIKFETIHKAFVTNNSGQTSDTQ